MVLNCRRLIFTSSHSNVKPKTREGTRMLTYKLWSRTKHNICWNLDVFLIFPLFEKSSSYFHIHECSVACRTLQLLMRVELWSRIRIRSKKWILVEIWGDLSVGVMTWHLRLGNNHRDLNFHFFVIKPKDGKRKTKIIIEQTRQHIVCYFRFFFRECTKVTFKNTKTLSSLQGNSGHVRRLCQNDNVVGRQAVW